MGDHGKDAEIGNLGIRRIVLHQVQVGADGIENTGVMVAGLARTVGLVDVMQDGRPDVGDNLEDLEKQVPRHLEHEVSRGLEDIFDGVAGRPEADGHDQGIDEQPLIGHEVGFKRGPVGGPRCHADQLADGDFIGHHRAVGIGHEVEIAGFRDGNTVCRGIRGILELHLFAGDLACLVQEHQ